MCDLKLVPMRLKLFNLQVKSIHAMEGEKIFVKELTDKEKQHKIC